LTIQLPDRHWDAAAEQPPSRAGYRNCPDLKKSWESLALRTRPAVNYDQDSFSTLGIIKLLRNLYNGGLCPFCWQEFRVFGASDMAGSCQTIKFFIPLNLAGDLAVATGADLAGLFRDLCQPVAKSVNDQFEAVGNVQF
jgi:hypothetical protein